MLVGFSIINHPFWGTPIFGNIHIYYSKGFVSRHLSFSSLDGSFNHLLSSRVLEDVEINV